MGRTLSRMLTVDAVVDSIHRYVSQLMDATNFYVALYDAERDEISFPLYIEGDRLRRDVAGRRAGKGMTEHIIRTRQPLLAKEDVAAVQADIGVESIGVPSESWLGVPLMIGERPIGVITVQSYTTPRVYDEHARDLLTAVAGQAAIAIQNARLFEQTQAALAETEARARRERIGREITAAVRASIDPDAIMRTAVRELGTALSRPAFVRMGNVEQLSGRPNGQDVTQDAPGTPAGQGDK
jgi:transcriptional regulator with GAF, ATPase, and Fis domain